MIRGHFFTDNIREFEKSQSLGNRLENCKLVGKEWQSSSLLMQRAEGTEEEEEEEELQEEVARKALVISVSDYNNKGLQPPDFSKKR
jgi:hypothetical protein